MPAFNCALIRDNVIVHVVVLDDDVPFDPAFLDFLGTYDEAAALSDLAGADPHDPPWVGWTRPVPQAPFVRPPGLNGADAQ